ncbi:hypothetical protein [Streptomyces sp. NPDC097981]|uniref:hypothetical protein n=1 Tax=Streptomyces sp. NPDC097981 TaxID=3155428 RepID=UPI0033293B19
MGACQLLLAWGLLVATQQAFPARSLGGLWSAAVASALLPLAAGACLPVRPVPLKALWGRGLAVTAAALAVVALTDLVRGLGG